MIRRLVARFGLVLACFGLMLTPVLGFAQQAPAQDKVQLFQAYFDALASDPHTSEPGKRHDAENQHLIEIIPTMTTAELQRAVVIIDVSVEKARASHDGLARFWAGQLLWNIAATKDGPALMAPEIAHLSALCRDPFLLLYGFYMLSLVQPSYPELQLSNMLKAIQAEDANAPQGKGPAYATLLIYYPVDSKLEEAVLAYMQRPDLTGQRLLDFLAGISMRTNMPETIVQQLLRYLDFPQAEVRLAALRDIGSAGFAERERLKPLMLRLAVDPMQSEAFRALAAQIADTKKWVDRSSFE